MDADFILILKMKQGSDEAWETFVRKYYPDILKYCHFHCRDRADAEDLTQEVFLKFIASLPRYTHLGKAKNYLYTIAANLCKDHWRIQKLPPEPVPEPDFQEHLALEEAVRSLPEALREAVVLHYYQGLKLTEAAAVLRIGLPLMKYRIKRAKELLRKELEDGTE